MNPGGLDKLCTLPKVTHPSRVAQASSGVNPTGRCPARPGGESEVSHPIPAGGVALSCLGVLHRAYFGRHALVGGLHHPITQR